MLKKILFYGLIAGLVAGGALSLIVLGFADSESSHSMLVGYLTMLIAFTAVFVGIKRYRDVDLGGVIRFWPAFGMGVAMSVVAGILYVAAWETSLVMTGTDFAGGYANTLCSCPASLPAVTGYGFDQLVRQSTQLSPTNGSQPQIP